MLELKETNEEKIAELKNPNNIFTKNPIYLIIFVIIVFGVGWIALTTPQLNHSASRMQNYFLIYASLAVIITAYVWMIIKNPIRITYNKASKKFCILNKGFGKEKCVKQKLMQILKHYPRAFKYGKVTARMQRSVIDFKFEKETISIGHMHAAGHNPTYAPYVILSEDEINKIAEFFNVRVKEID